MIILLGIPLDLSTADLKACSHDDTGRSHDRCVSRTQPRVKRALPRLLVSKHSFWRKFYSISTIHVTYSVEYRVTFPQTKASWNAQPRRTKRSFLAARRVVGSCSRSRFTVMRSRTITLSRARRGRRSRPLIIAIRDSISPRYRRQAVSPNVARRLPRPSRKFKPTPIQRSRDGYSRSAGCGSIPAARS